MRKLFNPGSVAVIGATASPDRIGYSLLDSLIHGGYKGKIYPVHPRLKVIFGLPVYPSVLDIPERVDLALIALNQRNTVEVLEQCGKLGIKGAVIVGGGFRETGDDGQSLEKRLLEIAKKYGLKVVGPNTLGIMNLEAGLNATFYPVTLQKGNVSLVSQSGGIGFNIIHKCSDEGVGLNKFVGVGNRTVLEIADYLEFLAGDPGTKVIGVFLEGVEDARRLVLVAGEVARRKPVVIYKVGQSNAINEATLTHTGSMAGPYKLFRDIFNQYGILLVSSVPELVAACKALSLCRLPAGGRLGLYSYTAGPTIVALDCLAGRKISMPGLSPETVRKIKAVLGEDLPVILKNPIDTGGLGVRPDTYGLLVEAALADPNFDLLLTFCCPNKNWPNPTRELIAARQRSSKPLLACYISTVKGVDADREALHRAGIPLYCSPDEAAWGAAALVHYSRRGGPCMEIRRIIENVRKAGRTFLTEVESKELLAERGIPVVPCRVARDEEEAVRMAREFGFPVVLKVNSPHIIHKSDHKGVFLNLEGEQPVREAFRSIRRNCAAVDPDASVTVQPMIKRGVEVLIGAMRDRQFGPVVAFGLGGVFTEVLEDVVFRMAPVSAEEAEKMIYQIKGNRLLRGYRGYPAVDTPALQEVITGISQLAVEIEDIEEMDLNPVVVFPQGALVLDARIKLS
jgi:acetyltransferase